MLDPAATIARLALAPHPEGGHYREVFRDQTPLTLADGRVRSASTAILFLLAPGEFSAFHRVRAAEIWHHYAGGALTLHALGRVRPMRLDADAPVAVVPADVWQAAELDGDEAVLCGCTVAPGFDFADFEMGGASALAAAFPQQAQLIGRLTRR